MKQLRQAARWYSKFGVPIGEERDSANLLEWIADIENEFNAEEPASIFLLMPRDSSPLLGELAVRTSEAFLLCDGNFFDERLVANQRWAERLRQVAEPVRRASDSQMIAVQIERFLNFKSGQSKNGQRAVATFGDLKGNLEVFKKFVDSQKSVNEITGSTVTDFYSFLLAKSCGHIRKQKLFNAFKQWLRWVYRQDDSGLEKLPRNLDSKDFVFYPTEQAGEQAKPTRSERLFTPAEIKTLLAKLPANWQAYILLGLNCGFTQVDLSYLEKRHLDLKSGRLTIKRHKKGKAENTPVVNYKLWPETVKAIRAAKSDHSKLIFTTRNGLPLISDSIVSLPTGDRRSTWDTISSQIDTITDVTGDKNKTFKYLRKTGSTALSRHETFAGVESLYLGHAYRTIADKHYNAKDGEPYPRLDKATDWLRQHLLGKSSRKPR